MLIFTLCFFFNYPATTEIYTTTDTLSLHDALPIYRDFSGQIALGDRRGHLGDVARSEEHTSELQSPVVISYAVFCLKKKKKKGKNRNFDYIYKIKTDSKKRE